MNNLVNVGNSPRLQRASNTPSQSTRSSGAANQQFSALQNQTPQFSSNILQLLITLIQQLLQLVEREQPQDRSLDTDDATRSRLADILGVPANTIKVTDQDGNGQLSEGDLVEGLVVNDTGEQEPVRYELSALALRDINGEFGPELPIADNLKQSLHNVLGLSDGSQPQFISKVFDNDGSGKLSAGDVVSFTGSGIPPFSTNYAELTADQVNQVNVDTETPPDGTMDSGVPNALNNISSQQDANIRALFSDVLTQDIIDYSEENGFARPYIISDDDNSGSITASDRFIIARSPVSDLQIRELSADDVDLINGGLVDGGPLPESVSGGGVTIGLSDRGEAIPNDRIITIEGRNYSVGFLKQQVDDYSNSSYPPMPGDHIIHGFSTHPWGTVDGSDTFSSAFESYISDTFPLGDPDVPANPPVRYENATLIVNGQAYAPQPETLPLTGGFVEGELLIQSRLEGRDDVRQSLDSFDEVGVINENELDGFSLSHITVDVPANYLTQWKAALEDNLPAGSNVFFNRIYQLHSEPGAATA